jgi:hypothetical protein
MNPVENPSPQKRRRAKPTPDKSPILAFPFHLAAIISMGMFVIVTVCVIAGQAYRKHQSESAAWLLLACLVAVVLIFVPLFYGIRNGVEVVRVGIRLPWGGKKPQDEDVPKL